ncbi:histidine kinase [Tieghemostelium lacteum]|uniref:Histidine kinase n=1 Tax=Tieghemostelium lacteum TaxID=361077 RepID=A0A151ZE63_TIELA|nr:histidine kinase [Tieghemostelium lacteum]|eukprot:KYQ92248.1 histidine kinase [Tieghemostelium lacteum]
MTVEEDIELVPINTKKYKKRVLDDEDVELVNNKSPTNGKNKTPNSTPNKIQNTPFKSPKSDISDIFSSEESETEKPQVTNRLRKLQQKQQSPKSPSLKDHSPPVSPSSSIGTSPNSSRSNRSSPTNSIKSNKSYQSSTTSSPTGSSSGVIKKKHVNNKKSSNNSKNGGNSNINIKIKKTLARTLKENHLLKRNGGLRTLLENWKSSMISPKQSHSQNLQNLFDIYEKWSKSIIPKLPLEDSIIKMEQLGKSKLIRNFMEDIKVGKDYSVYEKIENENDISLEDENIDEDDSSSVKYKQTNNTSNDNSGNMVIDHQNSSSPYSNPHHTSKNNKNHTNTSNSNNNSISSANSGVLLNSINSSTKTSTSKQIGNASVTKPRLTLKLNKNSNNNNSNNNKSTTPILPLVTTTTPPSTGTVN